MPSFESVAVLQDQLIRKALGGIIAVAPTTVALPTALTTGASADLQALPTGYKQLGLVTKDDGVTFSRETDTTDTTSWGRVEPTRRDIVSDVRSAAFTCQETNKTVLEMYENVDLSTVQPDATTGETTFNATTNPQTRYRRMIFLSYDGAGSDRIYIAKLMPRTSVSEAGEQTWSDQGELNYPMTITAFSDSTLGYSVRYVFGGPGWRSLLDDMGFILPAPVGLATGSITSTSVALTWTAVTNAASYVVQKSTDSGATWTDVSSGAGGAPTSASTTVTGLTTATAYRFRVLAVDANSVRGAASDSVSATTS